MNWQGLVDRAKGKEEWEINNTDALWSSGDILAYIFIYTPVNTLDPVRERIALLNQDIIFCCHFLSDGPDMYDQVNKFSKAWNSLWEDLETPPRMLLEDPPPKDFTPPISLEWSPELLRVFDLYQVSRSSLAPLWGQDVSHFGDYVAKLDSGPIQIIDPEIKYNQEWVERNFKCPFCKLENPSSIEIYELKSPEQIYYDPDKILLAIICPKCSRFVEVIPRQRVEEMV